jgi:transcription termination factor Rho
VAADALEQSVLESKDREQLIAIASALGVKSTSRAKKADLIQKILEQTGALPSPNGAVLKTDVTAPQDGAPEPSNATAELGPESGNGEAAESVGRSTEAKSPARPQPSKPTKASAAAAPATAEAPAVEEILLGEDGEPLADWEIELIKQGISTETTPATDGAPAVVSGESSVTSGGAEAADEGIEGEGEGESRNRRRRRRRNKNRGEGGHDDGQRQNNRGFERDEAEAPPSQEPVKVAGYLDLRDEGYGFLRVNGYLPSREDAYIPVKLTRQYGLRKGDFVTGLSRPAGRNEKNPALLEVHTVNGDDPEKAKTRPRFEDLTPLFPDEKLRLENPLDPTNMTARIIDLISPIGMGQRGIIVSPPKAGKTTVMKTIATSIERNNPQVKLIVLLIDERPEEVTDMRRTVEGEVIASTFDRPSEEHTHVAELCIEKAKRLVERGEDVVIILDGITRLSRAYNLAAPATGRIMSGGIDAGALYPPKKFFGAARNVEEGGSLTILATALVETNSRMDDAIFEEFKGTGNMELRLDRRLAERRIYPAIDVDASSTRHEELLFDRKQLQMVWKLRRVLSGLAADGNAAPGLELLIDRLKTFRTNDEFLAEISKQPTT